VLFVVVILSDLESRGASDETAALVFILMGTIRIGLAMQMRTNLTLFSLSTKQNSTILKSLGKDDEADMLNEDSVEVENMLLDSKYKFWINTIGAGLVSVIAILFLIA
jgi:hypothetical protein